MKIIANKFKKSIIIIGGVKMKYKAKKEVFDEVRRKYKTQMFIDETGYTISYLTNIFNGRIIVPKSTAYAITKCIDKDGKILDYFKEV